MVEKWKRSMRLTAMVVGVGGVLFGCAGQDPYGDIGSFKKPATSTAAPVQTFREPKKLIPEEGWRQVAKWSGKGIMKTDPFQIRSQKVWRVVWDARAVGPGFSLLNIYVKNKNGKVVAEVSNTEHRRSDFNYGHLSLGPGRYSLVISSAESLDWSVMVEEPK